MIGNSDSENATLCRVLLEPVPEGVVLIGSALQPLRERIESSCACQLFDSVDACAAATGLNRDSTALLSFAAGDEQDPDSALGMTCRLFPERVLVRVAEAGQPIAASRFFAFGFRRLTLPEQAETETSFRIYEYRLSDYKQPPDWLNARYWANPERFEVLEPEYDETGRPLPDDGLQTDDDDFEPEEDEYE